MENNQLTAQEGSAVMIRRDYWLGIIVGLLIGVMFLPVLKIANINLYEKLKLAIIPFFVIGTPLGLIICQALSKKIPIMWQFGKFFVTGIMNVLVDFGILAIETAIFRNYLHINSTDIMFTLGVGIAFYSLFKAISFTVSNINSYFWNKYWTFDRRGDNKSEFVQFFTVSIIGFIINVVVASLVFGNIHPAGGMNYDQWSIIGAACGSIAGLFWNFFGYKFIVFKS